MSIVVPIKLSNPTTNILQVISLFPPSPIFQPGIAPSAFVRDTSVVSFGFPFSVDTPFDGIDLTTASVSATGSDLPNVYPLPPNSYALLLPSQIYNNDIFLDTNFSILLIDVTVCPVQPGISRLRVDYMSTDSLTGNPTTITDYLDMPFWEIWDNHTSDLNNIVNYSEQAVDFLQSEINVLSKDLYNNLNRGQLKGLSVSGQIYATQALQLNNSATPNNNQLSSQQKFLQDKFTEYQTLSPKLKTKSLMSDKTSNYVYNITSVSPSNGLFPGEQIEITTDVSMQSTDQIYLATYPLQSFVNGNTITATIPANLTFELDINVSIVGQNITKSASYPISIFGNPNIISINGIGNGFVAPGGSFVLYGENLGVSQGATSIIFNNTNTSATITSWTDKAITGVVPSVALSGPVILTTDKGGIASIVITVLGDKELDLFAITPEVSIVETNQTIQFVSTVNDTIVNSNWSIVDDFGNINNGDAIHGFINSSTGLYTAPTNVLTTFNLKVVANHTRYYGTLYDEVSVLVVSTANTYTISPSSTILEPSFTQPFELLDSGGNKVPNVTWYVNGFAGGTFDTGVINYEGLYQAPNILPTTKTLNVTGVGPNGLATAIVSITSVGSTISTNNLTGTTQSHSFEEKTLSGPSCCLTPIANVYSATVGTPLIISDYATSNGQNTDNNNVYYVTAFLQSNCGNQDGNLYVGTGGNLDNYGLISYIPQSIGFASIQVLSTITQPGSGGENITTGGYSTIVVNITAAPIPLLESINAGCPGQNVVLTGQYFPPDAKLVFSSNNQILPTVVPPNTVDGTNYYMTVTIPSNTSILSNTYNVVLTSSFTSNSNIIVLNVPTSCAVPVSTMAQFVVSPAADILQPSAQAQYNAILEFSDGSQQNVNTGATWYVENIQGGNSTYGTISSSGLYTAPASTPAIGSVTITSAYVYQNTILQSTAYASIVTPTTTPTVNASQPPLSNVGSCCLLTVTPNIATVIVPGNSVQFFANFSINGGQSTVVVASQWFVNGIAGGNSTYGTISNSGLYTPPSYYVPRDVQSVTVGASLVYTPTGGTVNTYNGYSIITFQQVTTQSGNSEITFSDQLNVYFGDGRFGYVPGGNTTYCPAGSYLYVTYQETLDTNFLPINQNEPQVLTFGTISAQSPQLLSVLYNEGTVIQDANNDGGAFNKPLTIPIGIVDPTSGLFQSMWDAIPVTSPQANIISPQPLVCSLSHDFHDDTPKDDFSIVAHIDNRFGNTKPKLDVSKLDKILWFGKASYKNKKLTFEKEIQAINFDKVTNSLNKEVVNSQKSFKIASNQILVAIKNDSGWDVSVLSLGDTLPEDSRIYVLGIVIDQFYSLWPLLKIENSFTKNLSIDNFKYIKFGKLIMQWGSLVDKNIKFPIAFENSYSLKTSAINVEQSLDGFNFTTINKDQSNFWFAIGS
jgi:hypothetical protein